MVGVKTISFRSEDGQSNNRLFIFLAIGLVGLMFLGLIGLGGALFWRQSSRAQEQAASLPTPDIPPPTPEPTNTPLPPTPTDTPTSLPTATATAVVSIAGGEEAVVVETEAPQTIEDFMPVATATPLEGSVTPTNTPVIRSDGDATPVSDSGNADLTAPPAEMPAGGGVLPDRHNSPLIWAGLSLLIILMIGVFLRRRAGIH